MKKPPDPRLTEAVLHITNFAVSLMLGDPSAFAFGLFVILVRPR